MYNLKYIVSFVSTAVLAGCMVGPDYKNPAENIGIDELDEPDFSNVGDFWKTASPSDRTVRSDWWSVFGDARLDSYMQICRAQNPDLKSLFYKVEQARENACMAESALYPHVNGGGAYVRSGVSDHALLPVLGTFDDWFTGAALTWDADLFGRIRSMLESERASAQAMRAQYENMLLLLQTQVASTYFTLRELEAERSLLAKTVKVREGEKEFVEKRVKMRSSPDSDLQRAIEQESSARAQLSELGEQIALAKNYLANLLGTSLMKISIEAAVFSGELPSIPRAVPSELLERRADIAAAERMVCAANSRIGTAQAAFFPTVSITSAVGVDSTAFSKLFNASSFAWGVSPQIYIPIFQAGRLVAQKRIALAKHAQALQDYRSTVLKAVREVEDALARSVHLESQYEHRKTAAEAARKVEEYAQAQYEAGVADYFAASEAHRYALMNSLALIKVRGGQYRACVALISALGGSWKNGDMKSEEKNQCGLEDVCVRADLSDFPE